MYGSQATGMSNTSLYLYVLKEKTTTVHVTWVLQEKLWGRYDKQMLLPISLLQTILLCFLHSDWHGICMHFIAWWPQQSSYEFSHLTEQRSDLFELL